ncbi:MAG: hypothetical protein RMJ98_15205 [Myxococcales bacterium]|nr:hypothetical protein [Polyangiaceae bacterium]MDW8250641.1 hypothetical protein [Myxococcales bacterium]
MRRTPLALALTLLLAAGLPLACGGDEDEPPPPVKPKKTSSPTDPPETLDDFANQYPAAYCAAAAPCCKAAGKNGDQEACEKATFAQLALIKSSGTFDKAKGQSCITKLEALAGKSDACTTLDNGIPECLGAISVSPGPVGKAPGEPCSSSTDCGPPSQGEVRCEEVGPEPKRICQHVLPGKEDATPCVGDARQTLVVNEDPKLAVGIVYRCEEGLRCDASSRVCIPGVAIGGSCIASFDCTKDAYCAQGTCTAALSEGASCSDDDQCKSRSFCSSKNQCAAYLNPGAACSDDPDSRCFGGVCLNGKCTGEEPNATQLFCP